MKIYRSIPLLAALLITLPLNAAASEGELKSLQDYIGYSIKNSSALRSAYHSHQAALTKSPQATALPDPRISYGYFIESVETRVGPQEHKLGIAQSFPWFGTLGLRGDQANYEAQAELNRFLAIKNKLVFEVTKAYADLAYIDAAARTTKNTIDLVSSWERVLERRFSTGTGRHSDLVRVQLELAKLEDKLAQLKDARLPLEQALNSLLGRQFEMGTTIEKDFLAQSGSIFPAEISYQELLNSNPELLMLSSAIQAKQTGVKLAEKKFYPNITLGVDYISTGSSSVSGGGDDAIMSMVSMNLPVWWNKNRAAVDQAKASKRSLEQFKKDKEQRLNAEFSQTKFELRDAKRKVALYKSTLIPKNEESIQASYTAYEAGDAGFLDLIDSEQTLLEFQLLLSKAQADQIIAATKLNMLAGGYSQTISTGEKK